MQRIITGLAALLLAACSTTPSMQETIDTLNQRFSGHNAGDFFLSYGDPASKTPLKDSGTAYRWVSIEPPETQLEPVYHNYPAPGGKRFPVLESGTGPAQEPQYCELKIQADKKDIIRKISITSDSAGKRSNSLCSEIFQRERKQ